MMLTEKIRKGNIKAVICNEYKAFGDFIMELPGMFSRHEGEVLFSGRNEVRLFIHEGVKLVVKRYKRVNPIQRIVYTFFRRTKAERAFLYAEVLRNRGINTPHEVAYIEESENGLFAIGYFVSLHCPDPPAFPDLVPKENFNRSLAESLASFVYLMHKNGILHGDMNFGNFLYHYDDNGKCCFTVIDTNRSHFCQGFPERSECLKNFCTTTHRRDVFEFIVRRYASLRGWNEDDALKDAVYYLDKFEEHHRRKEKLKKKIHN
ncbi:MAG: lipopolysaccharide kinase InaA family protein [Prevotellaceae bacterium]|nr:lipopolysaccharide kinase InaA family protein [Prevotellaceae bacterium]